MLRVKKNLELRAQDSKKVMLREKYRDLEEANEEFERIVLTVMTRDLPKNMSQSDPQMIVMVLRLIENEHIVDGLSLEVGVDGNLLSPFESDNYPGSLRYRFARTVLKNFVEHVDRTLFDYRGASYENLLSSISESQNLLKHF